MGKQDRYDFEGADDSLDTDSTSSTDSTPENEAAESTATDGETDAETDTEPASTSPAASLTEVPHRVRYDSPKDGRTAKTIYLDEEQDLSRLRELQSVAEAEFDETVHRLDVYLAAFRSDLSDDDFLHEMRNIGYGYFD